MNNLEYIEIIHPRFTGGYGGYKMILDTLLNMEFVRYAKLDGWNFDKENFLDNESKSWF